MDENKKTAENTENTEKTDNRTDRFDLEKMMKEAEIERRQRLIDRKAQKKAEQIARKEKKARLAEEKKAKETEKTRAKTEEEQRKQAEKDKIVTEARNFEEYYDRQKLQNDKYLYDVFEGNDRDYLKHLVKECQQKKYPAGPVLNEFVFLSVLNRRLHINLLYLQKSNPVSNEIDKLNKNILEHQDKINKLADTLEKYREEKKKEIDLAEMHDTVMKEAETYIREHIGEFTFKCSECGSVMQADGIPHWAFVRGNDAEGNPVYYVWNQELWILVEMKLLPVAYMAFALHTSIENIKHTYEVRNKEKNLQFPKWIDMAKEEKTLKELQENWKRLEMASQTGRITKLGSA